MSYIYTDFQGVQKLYSSVLRDITFYVSLFFKIYVYLIFSIYRLLGWQPTALRIVAAYFYFYLR